MQTIVTDDRGVCPSVCLSRSSTRLHCAKTVERIKMLFGVNIPGGPWSIVLEGVLFPHSKGDLGTIFQIDPLHTSIMAEAKEWRPIEARGLRDLTKTMQK